MQADLAKKAKPVNLVGYQDLSAPVDKRKDAKKQIMLAPGTGRAAQADPAVR